MKVAILGCGPAGLLACHAACKANAEVAIFSMKNKSQIAGAQYLHKSIPIITEAEPEITINITKVGTRDGYAEKVYGHHDHASSWDRWEEGEHPAWRLNSAYDALWELYSESINEIAITDDALSWIFHRKGFDAIISSIPATSLCSNVAHKWVLSKTYIEPSDGEWMDENSIIYHGAPFCDWHRASKIEGKAWLEYPYRRIPKFGAQKGIEVTKPQTTDCDCWPEILRVGRYGKWQRDILSHEAYFETLEWLR